MKKPHASRPQNHRRAAPIATWVIIAALYAGAMDTAQHTGGGLYEYRGLVRNMIGEAVSGRFRGPWFNQNGVGEGARLEKIFPEHLTHGFTAAATQVTFATGNVMGNRHPVALGESADTLAKGYDLAHQFVAEHSAGSGAIGIQLEQIGAAKPHHPQTQENLSRPR
jgi:hypothetical protein